MGHRQHHYPALTLTAMTVVSIGLQSSRRHFSIGENARSNSLSTTGTGSGNVIRALYPTGFFIAPPASRHLRAGRQLRIRRFGSGTVQLRFCRRRVWTRLDRHEQSGCDVQWEPQCSRCSDLDFQRRHPQRRSRRHRHAHALVRRTSPASPPPPSSEVPDSTPACGPPRPTSCASSIFNSMHASRTPTDDMIAPSAPRFRQY